MCSTLGLFSNQVLPTHYILNFKKALSLTKHRGPDQSRELISESFAVGFNRLSIVGEGKGSQPILSEDQSILLICNGEIFNHHQLRESLLEKHTFSTQSDCEVILHLYEEKPETFINELKGQFAFQIYDKKNKKLILGRDRFGINPLFYTFHNNTWIVGSEIKSLFGIDNEVSKNLDALGIAETYFLYGPTPPRTCFEEIFQVIPGHMCVIDMIGNKIISNERYWRLPDIVERTDDHVQIELLRLLKQSVHRRTQGDTTRIGSYLSGGLDSAVIAALMCQENIEIEAFSVQFQSEEFDESEYQVKIAEYLKIPLNSIKGDYILDQSLSQVSWHIEHPQLRTAPMPLYHLSRLVNERNYKIVLCGEGADELLLGYPVFQDKQSSVENKVDELSTLEKLFNANLNAKELVSNFRQSILDNFSVPNNSIRTTQLMEIYSKMSRFLLVQQGDRLSMSHGVEQRFPFLDEDVIDFLFSIPEGQFLRLFKSKKLLRIIMLNSLPSEVIQREKQGYLAPMTEEMYGSKHFHMVAKAAFSKPEKQIIRSYFRDEVLDRIYAKYKSKNLTKVEAIAMLLVISTYILHKQFIDS